MEYEWDEAKRQANKEKHRIDLEAANEFEWDTAIKVPTMRTANFDLLPRATMETASIR